MNEPSEAADSGDIISRLKNLEERIEHLETILAVKDVPIPQPEEIIETAEPADKEEQLEYRIGQLWFAKVGLVVLEIGIAFLLSFPYKNIPTVLPGIVGYALTTSFFIFAVKSRKNYNYFSSYLLGGGMALLYFTTMRLYFFGEESFISSLLLEIILLTLISFVDVIISVRNKSLYLTALSLIFGFVTTLVSDNSYFIFILITLLALASVYLKLKYEWNNLILFGMILSYFTHFIWFINNPVIGKEISIVTTAPENLIFILIYSLIFASGNFLREKETSEKFSIILYSGLNATLSYGLFLIISLSNKNINLFEYHLLASILFLVFSIWFWIKEKSKYSTFIYAMLGYLALSVAIVSEFKSPDLFIWLCWQSLLVVSTAIWFRSKFIIVANFIIYIAIFIGYLAVEGKVDLISISYGIVALLSARILNWKKDRLELKTEQMRNAYLLTALFIIPYALYFAMPEGLISFSWITVAILYYVISLVLKNKKYRWMALFTFLMTVVYVFIIGVTNSDPTYKIISFVVLGVVMISVSLLYTKLRRSLKNIIKS